MEILLTRNPKRLGLFPIKYEKVWDYYKKNEASFWTAEEIDYESDREDWLKLDQNEIRFLKYIFCFLGTHDRLVGKNLLSDFMGEIQILEAKYYYSIQIFKEAVQSETIQNFINIYITEKSDLEILFNPEKNCRSSFLKSKWTFETSRHEEFVYNLLSYLISKQIFFSTVFCTFYWLKSRNLMPALTFNNELFSRDTLIDIDFGCHLFSMFNEKPQKEAVYGLITQAINLEMDFIDEAMLFPMDNLNKTNLRQYVHYTADKLLRALGYEIRYYAYNPFKFMDFMSLSTHQNTSSKSNLKKPKAEVFIALPQKKIDLFVIEKITNACGDFMEALGFEIETSEEPIFGSFFQRLKFVFSRKTSEEEIDDIFKKGKQALEANFLNLPTAEATAKMTNAAGNLISATQSLDECAIRLGAILYVKIQRDGKSIAMAETVSPKLMAVLDENPNILKNPSLAFDLLQKEKEPEKGFGEGEGSGVTV